MAVNIIVMGLPGDVKFPKILSKFRGFFKSMNVKNFWIREIVEDNGSQQATVEVTNMVDARKARTYLNNLPFRHGMQEYLMEAHISDQVGFAEEGYAVRESRRRPPKRNRQRSRSPPRHGYNEEASKLDMEIELLRKQRQVIEEERRLLLEQKKLEMIREYGPSASREFDRFDDFEPPRKRRQADPVAKKPRQKSPPAAKIPRRPKGLPIFFHPCKKLIAQMKPYIEKDTTPEEVVILIKLIRAAIRKDLAIALEDKDFIPTMEIIKLYRERHPEEEDEAFVGKILANIRASYLTTPVKVEKDVKVKKEVEDERDSKADENNKSGDKDNKNDAINKDDAKGNENDAKGKENDANDKENDAKGKENDANDKENDAKVKENDAEVDKAAIKEKAPEDTPANGEIEADAAAPNALKPEPNTSQELENISAGNLSEEVSAGAKTTDDTLEAATEDALLADGEKPDDWVDDWNTEETAEKVQ